MRPAVRVHLVPRTGAATCVECAATCVEGLSVPPDTRPSAPRVCGVVRFAPFPVPVRPRRSLCLPCVLSSGQLLCAAPGAALAGGPWSSGRLLRAWSVLG